MALYTTKAAADRATPAPKERASSCILRSHAKSDKEEKEEGGSGWESRRWLEGLYEDMSINIARSNYAMLAERTTPPGVRLAE